jgi:hypothetical protein
VLDTVFLASLSATVRGPPASTHTIYKSIPDAINQKKIPCRKLGFFPTNLILILPRKAPKTYSESFQGLRMVVVIQGCRRVELVDKPLFLSGEETVLFPLLLATGDVAVNILRGGLFGSSLLDL